MKRAACILFLSLITSISACSDDGTSGLAVPPPLPLENHVVSCVEDSNCAMVEIGCCAAWCLEDGGIGGSWVVAVNKAYEEIVKERNSENCDPEVFCRSIACPPVYPVCEDGECVLRADDLWSCEEDDDCVIVELGCCDHCNGGHVEAVHKDYVEEAKERLGDVCEEDQVCTEMACAPALARCTNGACESYSDSEERSSAE